jgi:hypothetical protein
VKTLAPSRAVAPKRYDPTSRGALPLSVAFRVLGLRLVRYEPSPCTPINGSSPCTLVKMWRQRCRGGLGRLSISTGRGSSGFAATRCWEDPVGCRRGSPHRGSCLPGRGPSRFAGEQAREVLMGCRRRRRNPSRLGGYESSAGTVTTSTKAFLRSTVNGRLVPIAGPSISFCSVWTVCTGCPPAVIRMSPR